MPFILPSRGDVHVNRPLTNISIAFLQTQEAFVADRVFPNIPVTKQSDDVVCDAADGRAIAVTTTAGDQTWGILLEGGVADDIVRMQFGLKDIDPGT